MVPTTVGSPETQAPMAVVPHSAGYTLFQQTLTLLRDLGWKKLRIDTYTHPDEVWTIRHHYTHGEWEWYFEPDRYWNPHDTNGKLVRVRLDRPPLPTVRELVSELLGITPHALEAALFIAKTRNYVGGPK